MKVYLKHILRGCTSCLKDRISNTLVIISVISLTTSYKVNEMS